MSKVNEIFQGFKNLIFPNQQIEVQAEDRLKKCLPCAFKKYTRCGKCGCLLAAKTRSPESKCPVNKW